MKTNTIDAPKQTSATALQRALAANSNDSRAICSWAVQTLRDGTWRQGKFKTFSEFLAAPLSAGGCKSSLAVVVAHAFAHPGLMPELVKVVTPAELEAVEHAVRGVKGVATTANIKPAADPVENARRASAVRHGRAPPPTVAKAKRDGVRDALNSLRHRAARPDHPKHEQAKMLLEKIQRGEMSIATAKVHAHMPPARMALVNAKTRTRALDAKTRQEFLDWLVDQGAVLSLVPNPAFAGFADGRKKPTGPVA